MREGWRVEPFENCIERVVYNTKIQRKEFLPEGDYPIVSQEDAFINGFWDKKEDLLAVDSPVVVFGDHTRTLKYIDFDFVLGADGVKVLKPKPFLDPKFFYYQLQTAKLDSLGYARHYRLLREISVVYPPLPEQRRIVAILDEAFEGIATAKANAEKNLQNAREVFESHLNAVFSQRGEGWVEKRLGDVCQIARGGSPRPIKAFLTSDDDGVNWIKISDATSSSKYIYDTTEKIKRSGVKCSRLVHDGDFLLSNSMSFGRPYIMRTTGCIHDGWLVLSEYEGEFNQDFLYQLLGSQYVYQQFDKLAAGSTVRNLNIDLASSVIVPAPPISIQCALAEKTTILDRDVQQLESLYQQKLTALDELKQSLLHQAFNGDL